MHPKRPIKPKPPPNFSSTHSGFKSKKFLFILMAAILSLSLLSLLLFFSFSTALRHHNHRHYSPAPSHSISKPPPSSASPSVSSPNGLIHEACKASRDPPTCESSLSSSSPGSPNPTVLDTIQLAIRVSKENLRTAQSMVNDILGASAGNLNRTNAAKNCLEVLNYSDFRSDRTASVLARGKIKDARAWLSAAVVYQYDCWSALKYVNGTSKVNETMAFLNGLLGLSSNALGMMVNYDNLGEDTGSWGPPKTERDGFWEGVGGSGLEFHGGVPTGLKPDVTVCKEGGCNYGSVQAAVNAGPDNAVDRRFVIWIKAGVYEETVRVPLQKKNVVFLGDGMGKTVITGSMNVGQPGVTTYDSATVGVVGDGFMASGLTIQNTAGPNAHQAVAFRSDSDLSVIENCEFLGNQDTLYAHSLRQYYKSCRIQGNVDFVFGNSAAFFQGCLVLVAPRQVKPEKGENNAVTAHGRIDPAQSTGFVFLGCIVNGTEEYLSLYYSKPSVHRNYLGRPWKEYSRTVFIQCTLEALITPDGWMPWSGDFALKTLYYGEFGNTGAGANTSKRVPWSSQIPAKHVSSYSVPNFIQGDQWIPTSS
ncbi:probable pectinesterase/pectinesterase inhibitor 51 [Coffea eugenioides]|uniref:probable pectinesterase/pectinesterase inhibitor 51 n=1 Tax=Coffea eugenioides TaxID=49369 RepID=UPI000F61300C|nr:probable pectinesterase/pectinesterase inhibitor 51 [Coffea eugenioides]